MESGPCNLPGRLDGQNEATSSSGNTGAGPL